MNTALAWVAIRNVKLRYLGDKGCIPAALFFAYCLDLIPKHAIYG